MQFSQAKGYKSHKISKNMINNKEKTISTPYFRATCITKE